MTSEAGSNGYQVCGSIEQELPYVEGKHTYNDGGPFSLGEKPVGDSHPILKNVSSFNGGKNSGRYELTMREPKNDEIIEIVAKWNDPKKTPLIITKQYTKSKSGNGRIVMLNFWPVSSRKDSDYWDKATDGDIIMQNAVIWACNALTREELLTKFSEILENDA